MLIKLVRWALALALGFIAFGAMYAGDTVPAILMVAGALVILPPVGAFVGRFAPPVARHGVAIAIGFALVLAGLAVTSLTSGGAKAPDGSEAADLRKAGR